VLTGIVFAALLVIGQWRGALDVVLGAGLFLVDIYLLRLPLELMLGRVTRSKRPWFLALTLARLVALGLVLFLIVRFRIAGPAGLFLGVTLPLAALVSVLVRPGRRDLAAG
jgi:hypothetical protein